MDLIILIGLQASGKSTFARRRLGEYVYVSKDAMRNVKKKSLRQETVIRRAFERGLSVVVDNTNPSSADRMALVALGREYGARVIGYYFASHLEACLERNRQREGAACVPEVALYTTQRKLELPAYSEGFVQNGWRLHGIGVHRNTTEAWLLSIGNYQQWSYLLGLQLWR